MLTIKKSPKRDIRIANKLINKLRRQCIEHNVSTSYKPLRLKLFFKPRNKLLPMTHRAQRMPTKKRLEENNEGHKRTRKKIPYNCNIQQRSHLLMAPHHHENVIRIDRYSKSFICRLYGINKMKQKPTCKNMAKTAKEPVLWKWGNYLSFFTDPSINIIDRLRTTRNILAMQLQVHSCKF